MKHRWWLVSLLLIIPIGLWANLPADFDNDGDVDFADFVAFAGKFGTARGDESYEAVYDINRDGAVDLKDYLEFAAEFGVVHSDKHALTPDELEALAKAHLDNGNYEQAVKGYLSFIAQTREHHAKQARGRKDLGMTYLKMNRLEDASEQFRIVLSKYKGSDDGLIRHQLLWSSLGSSEIASKQGNEQALVLYLAQATVFLPN